MKERGLGKVGYYPAFIAGKAIFLIGPACVDGSGKANNCVTATTSVRAFDGAAAQKISKLVDRDLRGVYTREFSIYSAHRLRIRSRSFGEWLSSPLPSDRRD